MEILGGLSGGTLGFITGGVPGAYYGYNVGKKLTQMARLRSSNKTPSRSRSRGRARTRGLQLRTPGSTSRPRRYRSQSSATQASIGGTNINSVGTQARFTRPSGVRFNVGAHTVVHSTGKKRKRKPIVKVSKTLRNKIQKVMSGKEIKGQTQEITFGALRWLSKLNSNQQIVYDITALNQTNYTDPMFSNYKVLDAASCLWNNKTQAADKFITTQNFDSQKLKVKVLSSSVTYTFRNNTQRDCNMKLMECRPVSAQVVGEPFGVWQAVLDKYDNDQGPNQNNILITELHTHPSMLPAFKKLFKVNTIDVHIPPGGSYIHTVQGPSMKTYDFAKYWNGLVFQNYQADACWLLTAFCPDLVTTTNGLFGRYLNDPILTSGLYNYGIVFEAVSRFKMELPEQAGFLQSPASVGTAVPLDQRQFSFSYKTYADPAGAGNAVRIDDENPVTRVDPN